MKEKLKAALKLAGLSEELANHITITSEDQIAGIVASMTPNTQPDQPNYTELLASEGFSKFVQENGFDSVLKASKTLQSEHDRKVTQGVKTFSEKVLNVPPNGTPTPTETPSLEETPAWAKALFDKVGNLEKQSQQSTKLEQAQTLLKSSKLPAEIQKRWESRIQLESETSFEDQIKSLETEHDELFKGYVAKESGSGLPVGGQSGTEVSDDEIADIFD